MRGADTVLVKTSGNPFGDTDLATGRHPVKMSEPTPAANAPGEVVYLILGLLQFSDASLRINDHPDMLRAAANNCDDFAPFIKAPGLGASITWHQAGTMHWDSPDWRPGSHDVNFMAQV